MSETEKNPSLGAFLREERERRGLSLDQVSSVTKIGVRILQSLEQDRYSELPALPFVKGFIKTYCQLLQLDTKQVLRDYDAFLKEKSKSRPNREGGMSGYAFEKPEGEQAKRMLWVVMGVMLVFGGLVVFVFKPALKHRKHGSVAKLQASPSPSVSPSPSGSVLANVSASPIPGASGSPQPSPSAAVAATSPSPVPTATALAVAPSPSPTPSPSPSLVASRASPSPSPAFSPPATPVVLAPSPAATAAALPPVQPSPSPSPSPSVAAKPDPLQSGVDYAPSEVKFKVVIRALADVWVRYQCDDKKMMRFVLKQGRVLVLRGKNGLKFQASNPASVSLVSNGRRYPRMDAIPQTFKYQETPTLIWPLEARSRVAEIFQVNDSLPETPGPVAASPSPAAPAGEGAEPSQTQGNDVGIPAEDLAN